MPSLVFGRLVAQRNVLWSNDMAITHCYNVRIEWLCPLLDDWFSACF